MAEQGGSPRKPSVGRRLSAGIKSMKMKFGKKSGGKEPAADKTDGNPASGQPARPSRPAAPPSRPARPVAPTKENAEPPSDAPLSRDQFWAIHQKFFTDKVYFTADETGNLAANRLLTREEFWATHQKYVTDKVYAVPDSAEATGEGQDHLLNREEFWATHQKYFTDKIYTEADTAPAPAASNSDIVDAGYLDQPIPVSEVNGDADTAADEFVPQIVADEEQPEKTLAPAPEFHDKVDQMQLDEATDADPCMHFVKAAARFGRSKRRWFVLHRKSHKLAYYTKPFVPPQKGQVKGVVDLTTVVEVNATGNKLELAIFKGRKPFKLTADSPKIAEDWAKLLRLEANLSGLDNPLQHMVDEAVAQVGGIDADDLYAEYGGFKHANENLDLYHDVDVVDDPTLDDDDDGGDMYNTFEPNDAVRDAPPVQGGYLDHAVPDGGVDVDPDDWVPSTDGALDDAGYLDQVAPVGSSELPDTGYLDHVAPVSDGADDWVPPSNTDDSTENDSNAAEASQES